MATRWSSLRIRLLWPPSSTWEGLSGSHSLDSIAQFPKLDVTARVPPCKGSHHRFRRVLPLISVFADLEARKASSAQNSCFLEPIRATTK